MGIYSSKNPKEISGKERDNSVDFMALAQRYKKINKDFLNTIKKLSQNDFATLETVVKNHNQSIKEISIRANELLL